LKRAPLLERYATLASAGHERADGSGYHRGLTASAVEPGARLLAAADVYHALVEERAYRPAYEMDAAATMLADEARAGRLDRAAVEAVLAAAGHAKAKVRGAWPRGLTDREVDVLRLVARGLTNKEVGARLFVSPKTVQRHLESIFGKTGVRTRAAAAVFAVEEGL
jgi:DNA-binding NarL/FixJ family response regulator